MTGQDAGHHRPDWSPVETPRRLLHANGRNRFDRRVPPSNAAVEHNAITVQRT